MEAEKAIKLRSAEKKEMRNPYYLHVSGMYRVLKWGTLLLFALYLVMMLALQRESITYENLMYLMRDLNLNTGDDTSFAAVSYEEQQNARFAVFQNALATAGSSGVRLYDGGGSLVLSDSTSYKSPVLLCGEKYMLLYDAGGTEYALFTSLSCVERGKTEGLLQAAAVSDSGAYCIVTRSDEAKYVITLYNANFRRVARYFRDSYVISAAIHPEGHSLAVLSTALDDWTLDSEVTLYSANTKETVRLPLGDSLPVAAQFLSNGNLAVICDDSVFFFTETGKQLSMLSLSSMTLSCFSVSDNKVALVCQENVLGSASRIIVTDSAGNILCDERRADKITAITAASGENSAYIQYNDHVETLSVQGSVSFPVTKHLYDVCEIGGRAVLCYASEATALDGAVTAEPKQ